MTDHQPHPQSIVKGAADQPDLSQQSAEAEPALSCRPTSLDPQEIGFTPRRPVGWLAPLLLLNTGLRTLGAMLFGAYLDKRELQNALDSDVHVQPGVDGELWLDYVADIGDGFNATYSVAYLLAQPELVVDGHRLPRGQVLVMGGDQVYPTASGEGYEDRTKGPYEAALPEPPVGAARPTLYALPGNHDWYDGLTAFLRLFARRKDARLGGWRTEQRRSYFAVKLPARWWLFAIDEQFGAYIDDPQLLYFETAARQVGPDDRIILITPSPTWVKGAERPDAYDSVDYFIRTILAPTGAQVRLLVSGDLHHYARYTGADRDLVTCGGGGAYLLGTHTLPERLVVPPKETLSRRASRSRSYDLATCYPSRAASRRMIWGAFHRIPLRNAGFATMLGMIQTLTMLTMAGASSRGGDVQRLFTIPLVIMLAVILGATVLFAQPPGASADRHARHWIMGLLHGFAQIALAIGGTAVCLRLEFRDWPWPFPLVLAAVVYWPLVGLLSTQVAAAYLVVASWFKVNVNELFAGQGIEDVKCFLRMHIAADGTLTVYPIGVDTICRQWEADPHGRPGSSWIRPVEPLGVRLIEPPIGVAKRGDPRTVPVSRQEG